MPAMQQYNNTQQTNKKNAYEQIKNDALINTALTGAIGAFDKIDKNTSKIKGIAKNIGGGLAGGFAGGVTGAAATYAGNEASQALKEKYMREDNKPSLLHAGMIYAPAAAGSVYSFGAMMHGMDAGKKIVNSKHKTELFRNLKHAFNPAEHLKRGIKEVGEGFKAFNPAVKMSKFSRFLKGSNLLGLGLSAIPAISYYLHKKKQQEETNKSSETNPALKYAPYIDDVANIPNMIQKKASYVPIITSFKKYRGAIKDLKQLKKNYGDLAESHPDYKKLTKAVDKHKSNMVYDTIGVGLAGGVLYDRYHNRNKMESYKDMATRM